MNAQLANTALDLFNRDMKVLLVGPVEGLPSFLYMRATVVAEDNWADVAELITRPSGCILVDPERRLDSAIMDKLICIQIK